MSKEEPLFGLLQFVLTGLAPLLALAQRQGPAKVAPQTKLIEFLVDTVRWAWAGPSRCKN